MRVIHCSDPPRKVSKFKDLENGRIKLKYDSMSSCRLYLQRRITIETSKLIESTPPPPPTPSHFWAQSYHDLLNCTSTHTVEDKRTEWTRLIVHRSLGANTLGMTLHLQGSRGSSRVPQSTEEKCSHRRVTLLNNCGYGHSWRWSSQRACWAGLSQRK